MVDVFFEAFFFASARKTYLRKMANSFAYPTASEMSAPQRTSYSTASFGQQQSYAPRQLFSARKLNAGNSMCPAGGWRFRTNGACNTFVCNPYSGSWSTPPPSLNSNGYPGMQQQVQQRSSSWQQPMPAATNSSWWRQSQLQPQPQPTQQQQQSPWSNSQWQQQNVPYNSSNSQKMWLPNSSSNPSNNSPWNFTARLSDKLDESVELYAQFSDKLAESARRRKTTAATATTKRSSSCRCSDIRWMLLEFVHIQCIGWRLAVAEPGATHSDGHCV